MSQSYSCQMLIQATCELALTTSPSRKSVMEKGWNWIQCENNKGKGHYAQLRGQPQNICELT